MQVTNLIFSRLLNLSFTRQDKNGIWSLITVFIEIKGDNKINPPILYLDAR